MTDPILVRFDKGDESDFEQYQLTVLLCLVLYRIVMVIFCGPGSHDPSLITVYKTLQQLPTESNFL